MRVGVVSDSHDNLSNVRRIVETFASARVERIVDTGGITRARTGDITRARTLELFAELGAAEFPQGRSARPRPTGYRPASPGSGDPHVGIAAGRGRARLP